MLKIQNLDCVIEQKSILQKLCLSIDAGSVHAIMGPNGSGKSTLASVLAGHPAFTVTGGTIHFEQQDLLAMSPDKRAKSGLFLALQSPPAVPGVRVITFLKEVYQAVHDVQLSVHEFQKLLQPYLNLLKIDSLFLSRSLNDGFSGGERKRFEMLQLLVLKPKFAILDEIDSGLDIDALKIVAQALAFAREGVSNMSVLLITHYQRILEYIHPDHVHVLADGAIQDSGDLALVSKIEQHGYDRYQSAV